MNANTSIIKQTGCSLCGKPVLEDHNLCSICEIEFGNLSTKTATIYEFPSGKIIKNYRKLLTTIKM